MSLFGQGQAQVQTSPPPALPSVFTAGSAIASASGRTSKSDDGLAFTLGFTSLYDSNVTQVSSGRESDWIFTPSLQAEYSLGNSSWKLGARSSVEYNSYQNRADFSATDYSFRGFGAYKSKKVDVTFSSGLASTSGFNRWANEFVEQLAFDTRFKANYHFTGKTSLQASWDNRAIESQTEGYGDTSSETATLSAIWKATPLISLGPGFRYGTRTGNDDEVLTVMGPTLRLDYQLSTKVKFRSSLGLDYSDSPFTGEDTLVNWSVGLNYRASSLWGFDLEANQDTRATLSTGGGFDEISSYRLNYWHKIRRARLELGVSYQDRNPTDSQQTFVGLRDSQYLTLSTAVYRDQAKLTLRVNWRDQVAADDLSWDGFQTSLGLRWQF